MNVEILFYSQKKDAELKKKKRHKREGLKHRRPKCGKNNF